MSKAGDPKLQRLLQQGGEADSQQDSEALKQAALARGLAWCVADCDKARSRSAVFRAIVKAVDYPEFFGNDFDALFDCLCDTLRDQKVGVVLVIDKLHSADPAIVEDGHQFLQTLVDAVDFAQESGRTFIYVLNHAGKHPEATPGVVHNWSDAPE